MSVSHLLRSARCQVQFVKVARAHRTETVKVADTRDVLVFDTQSGHLSRDRKMVTKHRMITHTHKKIQQRETKTLKLTLHQHQQQQTQSSVHTHIHVVRYITVRMVSGTFQPWFTVRESCALWMGDNSDHKPLSVHYTTLRHAASFHLRSRACIAAYDVIRMLFRPVASQLSLSHCVFVYPSLFLSFSMCVCGCFSVTHPTTLFCFFVFVPSSFQVINSRFKYFFHIAIMMFQWSLFVHHNRARVQDEAYQLSCIQLQTCPKNSTWRIGLRTCTSTSQVAG